MITGRIFIFVRTIYIYGLPLETSTVANFLLYGPDACFYGYGNLFGFEAIWFEYVITTQVVQNILSDFLSYGS